jgi:PAS domain S-box-containing protein
MDDEADGTREGSEAGDDAGRELRPGGGRLGVGEILLGGVFRKVNDELCRIVGRPRAALLGTDLTQVVHPDDVAQGTAALARVLDTGEPAALDKRYVRPDGSIVFTHSVLTRLEDEQGRPRAVLSVTMDLTDRREMMAALRESEERYRTLFHSIDEGVCVLEMLFGPDGRPADYRWLDVNPAFERHTGLENAVGRTARELVPDLDASWLELYGKVALTGEATRFENHAPAMDRWFDVFAFRVGAPEQRRVALLFTNITERKRRELDGAFLDELHLAFARLSRPEDLMRAAGQRIAAHLRVSSVAFAEIDAAGEQATTLWHERQVPSLASGVGAHGLSDYMSEGYLAELRAGRTVAIDDIRSHPLTRDHARAYAPFGVVSQIDTPHLGDERWKFLLTVQDRRPRAWRPHELELLRDVSTRLWLPLERARAQAAVRESDRRFRLALAAADMGMWTWDPRGGKVAYDRRIAELFGLPPEERVAMDWLIEHRIHPQDAGAVAAALQATFDRASLGRYRVEFRVRAPERPERWILGYGTLFHEDGTPRMVGIGLDITDRKRAEEMLRDNDRRKDEFLATLAHELRNPLAPLEHGLEILRLAGGAGGAPAARVQEIMARQVRHMCRLVDDLLEVSRITRGKIELRKERMELSRVLHSAIETSGTTIDRARHKLTVSLPGESLLVDADAEGEIAITARREGGAAVVSVRDNGVGIAPEMLPRIFDMFTQAERAPHRTQGGLGIGLTLVRSLVQMHGGTVEARSEGPGKGAELIVRLPLAEEVQLMAPFSDERSATLPSSCRVLVVDDNRDAAESLGALLELTGADVQVAFDGPSALATLARHRPTVALLDLGMPGMDGFELARRMQADPLGRDVTLIAMTGWGQEEDRRRTREAGFHHHLVKPADLATLQRLLGSLDGRPPRDDGARQGS